MPLVYFDKKGHLTCPNCGSDRQLPRRGKGPGHGMNAPKGLHTDRHICIKCGFKYSGHFSHPWEKI
jgi:ribosomal protein S27AE